MTGCFRGSTAAPLGGLGAGGLSEPSVSMRTVVGVAEARAQLSDIVAQAANGQVTVIERYGRPTAAVIPFDALESLPDSGVSTDSKPSADSRGRRPGRATARRRDARAPTPRSAQARRLTLLADQLAQASRSLRNGLCMFNDTSRRQVRGVEHMRQRRLIVSAWVRQSIQRGRRQPPRRSDRCGRLAPLRSSFCDARSGRIIGTLVGTPEE